MRVIFRRAGRTLPREPVAVGDLAPLHPRSGEAEAGVPPDRRTDGTQSGLGFGELIHRPIDPARGPIHEAAGVRRPRGLPRIVHPRRVADGGLCGGGRVDVVPGV